MNDDDYDEHYLDSLRYLMGGTSDIMKWDPDDEYPFKTDLEKAVEEKLKTYMGEYFIDPNVDWGKINPAEMNDICSHKWVFYRGLDESFEFCEKCDVKK